MKLVLPYVILASVVILLVAGFFYFGSSSRVTIFPKIPINNIGLT